MTNFRPNRTHIFNPQNDLALADGKPTFTPPPAALNLARDGASLPLWYADPGDKVLAAVDRQWYEAITDTFGIEARPTATFAPDTIPTPWAWSPYTRRILSLDGASNLPDNRLVDDWRTLSSRVTSLPAIADIIRTTVPNAEDYVPHIAHDTEEALQTIRHFGTAIIKLPWSNSGRGQQVSDRTTPDELERRVTGMIRRQGAVEIAPFYDVRLNFAVLVENDTFAGYSLFDTDTHGAWTQNRLIADSDIEATIRQVLGTDVDMNLVTETTRRAVANLAEKYRYTGPVGIDFVVGNDNRGNSVMLPVEINWRRTMGHVAHTLIDRYVDPRANATFAITPADKTPEAYHPLQQCQIRNRRISDGALDIVPPGTNFRFVVRTHGFA